MRTRSCLSCVGLSVVLAGCSFRLGGDDAVGGVPPVGDPGFFVPPPDERPPVMLDHAPPPISGGTLAITRDGNVVVAADPDRDLVYIADARAQSLSFTVHLRPGDEPGRVVEDGARRAHVALRRGGAVVSIDLATGAVASRRAICGAPRGLAWDPAGDLLHVACADGDVVSLPAAGGDVVRRVHVGPDLRDVVVSGDSLVVSRFKAADLVRISASGDVGSHAVLSTVVRATERPVLQNDVFTQESSLDDLQPNLAWRTAALPGGGVAMLHQFAQNTKVVLPPEGSPDPTVPSPVEGSPYGAPVGGCGGLVQTGVAQVDDAGNVHMRAPMSLPPLGVDAAVSGDGMWVAVAHAGTFDGGSPVATPVAMIGQGAISIVATEGPDVGPGEQTKCGIPEMTFSTPGQVVAVAFNPTPPVIGDPDGAWLVAQSREPAALYFFHDPFGNLSGQLHLGQRSVMDTGHEIFHRDPGGGIACASCHAEGHEDGHTWLFDPIGPRRTQALDVGLSGSAPFHWDGDMPDMSTLMDQVLVRRMGGTIQSPERKSAMERWVFDLTPPAPVLTAVDPAVQRGKTLFESPDVGCSGCHSGPALTNHGSAEVGTTPAGHPLQIPSLRGIAYRAPFLHDGCAPTLQDRFTASCGGGDAHGRTSQLAATEVDDLIAYLESL